jgi:two-component system, NtrC family, sensor kinase
LASDIKENEQKISHHGKRAEAIVMGMLQHSRTSTGLKEPTDINALVEEYLNLSYHGFRAKDKSLSAGQPGFNATLNTDFDPRLSAPDGKIYIIPQEIGRVLLNLFNNAFYSINEKNSISTRQSFTGGGPTISVTTKAVQSPTGLGVEISVKDNGNGIPPGLMEKIFQPFFTTKPPGQGTGLGLSLSYDIITKQHGGTLKANTKTGEFAEFIILLPA